jgi:hypothetical protein
MNSCTRITLTTLVVVMTMIFSASCDKINGEEQPFNATVTEERNIPGAGDILFMEFANEDVVFCASATAVYRSTNAGQSWQAYEAGFEGGDIRSMVVVDENTALVTTENQTFRTADGNNTWTYVAGCSFLVKKEDGDIVGIRISGTVYGSILTSTDDGATFDYQDDPTFSSEPEDIMYGDDRLFIRTYWSFFDDEIEVYHVATGDQYFMPAYYTPLDMWYENDTSFFLGCTDGLVGTSDLDGGIDWHFTASESSWKSVDVVDDIQVACGDGYLLTNSYLGQETGYSDNPYTCLVKADSSYFYNSTFNAISIADKFSFYVAGNDGLFWYVMYGTYLE